jgi:hypothetical protein
MIDVGFEPKTVTSSQTASHTWQMPAETVIVGKDKESSGTAEEHQPFLL